MNRTTTTFIFRCIFVPNTVKLVRIATLLQRQWQTSLWHFELQIKLIKQHTLKTACNVFAPKKIKENIGIKTILYTQNNSRSHLNGRPAVILSFWGEGGKGDLALLGTLLNHKGHDCAAMSKRPPQNRVIKPTGRTTIAGNA